MIRIAVTELEYKKAKDVFQAARATGMECIGVPADEPELAKAIVSSGIQHAIVGIKRYSGPLYSALPKGGVLARFGVGHDGIDKDLATQQGILCANTPGALDDSVAECAIALIVAAARHIPLVTSQVRQGQWSPRVGIELNGKTLAVIGCGGIGRRVAEIASRGFGMNVIGCEVAGMDEARLKEQFGFSAITADYSGAVAAADFVSIHIPSLPATRHFINAQRLARLPSHSWLINTARGAVLDENALFDAVSAGQVGGAVLDVFENEPYQPVRADKDLRCLDRVIMTPHIGSSTQEACNRMAAQALENIRLATAGRFGEMNLLNPVVLNQKG